MSQSPFRDSLLQDEGVTDSSQRLAPWNARTSRGRRRRYGRLDRPLDALDEAGGFDALFCHDDDEERLIRMLATSERRLSRDDTASEFDGRE